MFCFVFFFELAKLMHDITYCLKLLCLKLNLMQMLVFSFSRQVPTLRGLLYNMSQSTLPDLCVQEHECAHSQMREQKL